MSLVRIEDMFYKVIFKQTEMYRVFINLRSSPSESPYHQVITIDV
jgi:hypothetical protein